MKCVLFIHRVFKALTKKAARFQNTATNKPLWLFLRILLVKTALTAMKYDVWPPQRPHMRRRFTPTFFTTAARLLAADRKMSSRSSPDWAK